MARGTIHHWRATAIAMLPGAVFAVALAGWPGVGRADPVYDQLYVFPGGSVGKDRDVMPLAGVIAGPDGSVIGAASSELIYGRGAIFQLTPPRVAGGAWSHRLLYIFRVASAGATPLGLVGSPAGELFGIAQHDGLPAPGQGVAFRLSPSTASDPKWRFDKLHVFRGGNGGATPSGGLVLDSAGRLIGTTLQGGAGPNQTGVGIAFRLAPPAGGAGRWSKSVLHRFTGSPDAAGPQGTLLAAGDGLLFGVSANGGTGACGTGGCGTVFQLRDLGDRWAERPIYSFQGGPDGFEPTDQLLRGPGGELYGVTARGGLPGYSFNYATGTVFRLDPPATPRAPWTETTLYQFQDGVDGSLPQGGLASDAAGALYGTTMTGGRFHGGTLFKLAPGIAGQGWTKTTLHNFGGRNADGSEDSCYPTAKLLRDDLGALFGTTRACGAWHSGAVYRLVP